ncbi:hypothetical protein F383_20664 [Gossypium arboreum]|uniref:Uncharacterized protein n=1 Tax=Gossypium arboreum TaxID=29729 RepID=A0A0B0NWZ8_GOSAR|nr:hypothetical protein F383_20664 [Gossypium arboreum]
MSRPIDCPRYKKVFSFIMSLILRKAQSC